jgi:hypothetical protein
MSATANLDREIQAFESMLPDLRQRFGSVWAVLVDKDFKAGFTEFQKAAEYAVEHFPDRDFLIRHTNQHPAHIPFIAIDP